VLCELSKPLGPARCCTSSSIKRDLVVTIGIDAAADGTLPSFASQACFPGQHAAYLYVTSTRL